MRFQRWMYVLPLRLRSLLRRAAVERELDEELRFHLDREIESKVAAGLPVPEARAVALRALGGPGGLERRKDQCRDSRRTNGVRQLFTDAATDLRLAIRLLWHSPGLVCIATLSLALGIGANTALFSGLDALMLRPLPVASPSTLWSIAAGARGDTWANVSYPMFLRLRERLPALVDLAASVQYRRSNIIISPSSSPDLDPVDVALVSGNYFALLGRDASIGRALGVEDDVRAGGHPVAVISESYWKRRFDAAADVLGRTLTLHGTIYTVIGVGPRGFTGDSVGSPVDLWVPLAMADAVLPERRGLLSTDVRANVFLIHLLARPRADVSVERASAAATVVVQDAQQERAALAADAQAAKPRAAMKPVTFVPAPRGFAPRRVAPTLLLLMSLVGLVLLVACANVAGLLLARAAARQREVAVRLALGASRGRIARQLLTESALLAASGGVLGLVFAQWATAMLARMLAAGTDPLRLDLAPDLRVLGFTFALSILTGLLFGVTPAVRGARVEVSPTLLGAGAAPLLMRAAGGRRRVRLAGAPITAGQMVVIAQIAVSLVLLVSAGLFVRSLRNLVAADLGYERSRTLLVWLAPSQDGQDPAASARALRVMQDRLARLPGVTSVSASDAGVLNGDPFWVEDSAQLTVDGHPATGGLRWVSSAIDERFFETVGMPLVTGRGLSARDVSSAAPVAVINESLARAVFGSENPLGRSLGYSPWKQPLEIVGVVRNAKYVSPREAQTGMIYRPRRRDVMPGELCIALRAADDPLALEPAVRQALSVDAKMPVLSVGTIDERLRTIVSQERLVAACSAAFATLALVLACIGLYGAIAFSVARRLPEMGIRLALGATRGTLLRLVLGDSARLALLGTLAGLPLATVTARAVSNRLFGITPLDPTTIGAAIITLLAVALLAGSLPARRAARVDPMSTLRRE